MILITICSGRPTRQLAEGPGGVSSYVWCLLCGDRSLVVCVLSVLLCLAVVAVNFVQYILYSRCSVMKVAQYSYI